MKKILFTSTALVAFAGAAAAEVELSGRAEMGVFQVSGTDAQFFTDIDVKFSMSGETDTGLTFGADVDLDEGGNQAAVKDNADDGGATIYIKGSFGTVTMGDTDGALDWALTEAGNVGNPGSIADDETSHIGYNNSYLDDTNTTDGQILRWDYTSGNFGVAVSLADDNGSKVDGTEFGYAIGFKYSIDMSGTTINLGLGHQKAANNVGATVYDASATGVSVSASLAGGFSAGVVYTDYDKLNVNGVPVDNHVALGLGYETGPFAVHANYGQYGAEAAGTGDIKGFGLAAAYDLGGGAKVHFGYGEGRNSGSKSRSASFGLGLDF